jgi:hypothetical protein
MGTVCKSIFFRALLQPSESIAATKETLDIIQPDPDMSQEVVTQNRLPFDSAKQQYHLTQ